MEKTEDGPCGECGEWETEVPGFSCNRGEVRDQAFMETPPL